MTELSPEQLRAVQRQLRGTRRTQPSALVPRARTDQLSLHQQRLWFQERLAPGSPAYNAYSLWSLDGVLDVDALRRALAEIWRRHEVLRSRFTETDGRPSSLIDDTATVTIDVMEVDSHDEGVDKAVSAAAEPFDLTAAPLARCVLYRIAGDRHLFLLTVHHILIDGWSEEVLWRELTELYRAFRAGRSASLPALPIQYSDFATWQRAQLTDEKVDGHLRFWRQALDSAPTVLELPTEHARPSVPSGLGEVIEFHVQPETTARLRELAAESGTTAFMAQLTVFQLLLARYSGSTDLVVGVPSAGRQRPELEGLIGFFVNSVPLRLRLSGDPSYTELLGRTRAHALEAFAHDEVPFERVVDDLPVERDTSRNPVFQVWFDGGRGVATPSLDGLDVAPVHTTSAHSRFDLELALEDSGAGLRGTLSGNADLFSRDWLTRMTQHFTQLLSAAVAAPGVPASGLSMLTDDERDSLVHRWDATATSLRDHDVLARFEDRTRNVPETVALRHGQEETTYAELDAEANRIAHFLRRRGVGPETVVGICLRRGFRSIAGILGILKADGVYFPLDSGLPGARLRHMVETAEPTLILVDPDTSPRLPQLPCPTLEIEAHDDLPATAPNRQAHPEQPTYIVNTSGSTGTPKGIVLARRTLNSLIGWALADDPRARTCAQVASLGFDVSLQEILITLVGGGTLSLLDEQLRQDPAGLLELFVRDGIDSAHLPPTLLNQLAEAHSDNPVSLPLRGIYVGGEALRLTPTLLRFLASLDGVLLRNEYGPSETHIITHFAMTGSPADWPELPPLGGPIPGTVLRILDSTLQPTPTGVRGELYVGGDGVARGYCGKPELTAERFVADPFATAPGARLYRSGDICYHDADGLIHFVGRADSQAKIRGYRVELGEIDTVISTYPNVHHAMTVVREDRPGDKRLVTYVTTDTEVDPAKLRAHAAMELPEYMLPFAIVAVDEFPLNHNGKVDRAALPAPTRDIATRRAPRTVNEEVLCGLYEQVLGVQPVGYEDGFFDLGGHSLLATRLISHIRATFGVALPLRVLFDNPTPGNLLRHIDGSAQSVRGLQDLPRPERPPLSFGQHRLWFVHQLEGSTPAYHIPVALRITGDLHIASLRAALTDVVRRHASLRTIFPDTPEGPYQRVLPPPESDIPMSLMDTTEADLPAALTEASSIGFDLTADLPLRCTVFALAPDSHVLLVTAHHIATDGWSLAPLYDDLATAYAARTHGVAPDLPPLPVQYTDYALSQHNWFNESTGASAWIATGTSVATQTAYWRERLTGLTDRLDLPMARPRPAALSGQGFSVTTRIDADTHAAIRNLAADTGTTTFMVMHAAVAVLLARLTGGTDIAVGTPVAGRHDERLEGLIGFFVNTLVLRTDLSGDPTFRALLDHVRDVDLGAFSHQDLPFERVVDVVKPARTLAHHPLFQVTLAFDNNATPLPRFPGLSVESHEVPISHVQTDLGFFLNERWQQGTPAGVECTLVCAADLFDPATAQSLATRFSRLVSGLAAAPDRHLRDVEVVSATERRKLAAESQGENRTVAELPLPSLIEAQVARTPNEPAVSDGRTVLTYAELNTRANRLARLLVAVGAGPERRVAIAVDRSADMVVALLAALKSGAAYIPIDPRLPGEHIALLLDKADPVAVVADAVTSESLPATAIVVHAEHPYPAHDLSDDDRLAPLSLHSPAYLLFTSGSTGVPKGVVVEHRSLVAYLSFAAEEYTDGPATTVLHTPISFDLSVTALYTPLVTGGSVVVADLEDVGAEQQPTLLKTTPSHLPMLSAVAETAAPTRALVIGGESLRDDQLADFRAAHPDVTIINEYGPTETTVGCTRFRLPPGTSADGPVPIGNPLWNTGAQVLDDRLAQVPAGGEGELYISGPLLTRGYWRQPGLTATRFIADPFGPPGALMYRTGDIVHQLPDGTLRFQRRADDQLKVRGFRIEPQEIESVLSEHPDVATAVVNADAAQRLLGYLVPVDSATVDIESIHAHVARRLPDYAVPSELIVLETLPTTRHGKVDKQALPVPERSRGAGGRPGDLHEKVLCELFADVLGVDEIGVEDDFFELGGHSLLAARLVARVKTTLGEQVSLRILFATPTVAGLATELRSGTSRKDDPLLRLRAIGSRTPLFCIHPITGIALCYSGLLRELDKDCPVYGLQSPILASGEPVEDLPELAARYVAAIRDTQPSGPYQLLGWSFGGVVAHEIAVQLQHSGAEVGLLAMMDSHVPDFSTSADVSELARVTDRRELVSDYSGGVMQLDDDDVDAIFNATLEHTRMLPGFTPGRFNGSVHFFSATEKAFRTDTAQRWQPHVTEDVHDHAMPCDHLQLMRPDMLAQVADILSPWLGTRS